VYLAVILDACSRRVIGWSLDRTLEDELTLAALRMALAQRIVQPEAGASFGPRCAVRQRRLHRFAQDSGDRHKHEPQRNPWDNAACESFMKTLKYEEVHRNEYRDTEEARTAIHEFLEKVYNQRRLHSALGYLPPAEFELNLAALNHKDAAARQLPV
jgi:putative transposase